MHLIPTTISMSAFSKTPKKVTAAVAEGPVLVMNRSDTIGMLINPEQWNQLVTELTHLRGLAEARANKARADANNSWVSLEEMDRQMAPYVEN